jgi:hypothetical protein
MLTAVMRKLFGTTTSIGKHKSTEPYIEAKQCTPPKNTTFSGEQVISCQTHDPNGKVHCFVNLTGSQY